jgi:DNA-binding transcriptional MocR family regulator
MLNTAVLTQTLAEKIAHALAERIVSGAYRPGDRLMEAALAKELGVSHGPIRDALRQLQNAGLVTISPYRGAYVTEYSAREIEELYEVRSALVGGNTDPSRGAHCTALAIGRRAWGQGTVRCCSTRHQQFLDRRRQQSLVAFDVASTDPPDKPLYPHVLRGARTEARIGASLDAIVCGDACGKRPTGAIPGIDAIDVHT